MIVIKLSSILTKRMNKRIRGKLKEIIYSRNSKIKDPSRYKNANIVKLTMLIISRNVNAWFAKIVFQNIIRIIFNPVQSAKSASKLLENYVKYKSKIKSNQSRKDIYIRR